MRFNFQTNFTDIIKGFAILCVVVLLLIYVPKGFGSFKDLIEGNKLDKTTIEQIATNAVKVHLTESNKELKELLKSLKKEKSLIYNKVDKANERVDEVAKITASLKSSIEEQKSDVYKDKNPNKTFDNTVVYRKDAEGNLLPTSRVFYHPEFETENKWVIQNYPLDFKANVIESVDKKGNEKRYVEVWMENNAYSAALKGKKFPIDLKKVEWAKREPSNSFMWNMRGSVGSVFSTDEWYPAVDFSLASYGKTKRDMDWRFLGFGLGGTNDNFYGTFTPFEYNLGNYIPLVENLFGGPMVQYGFDVDEDIDNVNYGLIFSVPF